MKAKEIKYSTENNRHVQGDRYTEIEITISTIRAAFTLENIYLRISDSQPPSAECQRYLPSWDFNYA